MPMHADADRLWRDAPAMYALTNGRRLLVTPEDEDCRRWTILDGWAITDQATISGTALNGLMAIATLPLVARRLTAKEADPWRV